MNKIERGKRGLIGLGIGILVLTVLVGILAVFCTIWSATDITSKWWLLIIAVLCYILSITGLIVSITFIWTGSALHATHGSIKDGNLGKGTVNMIKCPKCGNEVKPDDTNCGNCGTSLAKTTKCPKCGEEVPSGNKCCTKCGAELK